MTKTDIHEFQSDITDNVEDIPNLPKNATVEISGYSFYGKPSEEIQENWHWIGCKLFVTSIELSGCSYLTDFVYDRIMEQIEDYVCDSYSVGMRESQLDKKSKYTKIKDVDFEFENLEGDPLDVETLNKKYKNEDWFHPDTYLEMFSELSYSNFRMYHIIQKIEEDLTHFYN